MRYRFVRRYAVVAALLLWFVTGSNAQHLEVGLFGGASNFRGDVGPDNFSGFLGETHPAFGVLARYNFGDFISLQAHVINGTISGNDSKSNDPALRLRDMTFRSTIWDFGGQLEWNIMGYQPYALNRTFSPYIFVGFVGYHSDPQGKRGDTWVDLQPLGTEGQGLPGYKTPYSLWGVAIPAGVGVKYALNDLWNLGFEIGVRKTFDDYLDDVGGKYVQYETLLTAKGDNAAYFGNRQHAGEGGTRGNNSDKDWYGFMGITITYNFLDNGLVGARFRQRGRNGCKSANF